MSGPELEPLITVRRYRTLGQLIIESIIGFVAGISIFIGLISLPTGLIPILFGGAVAYGLVRLRNGWSRIPITVYRGGHITIGKELITSDRIASLDVLGDRVEAGTVVGGTILSYEHVVEAVLRLKDGSTRLLRLRGRDFTQIAGLLGGDSPITAEA